MTTIQIPTPAILANRKQAPVPAPPKPRLAAPMAPTDPGTIVRPGLVEETVEQIHDGVVKSKHLRRGQRVRPFVHGVARGGERIVGSVERIQGGAMVRITWASKHATSEHKAAYRWFDESLVDTTVLAIVRKPGFVSYQEA